MTASLAPVETIAGRRVLFVMAASPEYGEKLRHRFTPLFTGVGPVEAASAVSAALAGLEARASLPDLIVCLGSAGSRALEHAEVYQASQVSYRDMDASPLGFAKGLTPFLDLPAEIDLPLRIPGIGSASLSTGASIISGAAYDAIAADMVDMETYAVLRAAMRFSVPLIGLRGISDGRHELRHYGDWHEYLHVIDERLSEAVDTLAHAIGKDLLRLPSPLVGEG
jgi:adenosylhomocysteine nucleosidase